MKTEKEVQDMIMHFQERLSNHLKRNSTTYNSGCYDCKECMDSMRILEWVLGEIKDDEL